MEKNFVVFENANKLTLQDIVSMEKDGYEFEVSNGNITGVYVPVIK